LGNPYQTESNQSFVFFERVKLVLFENSIVKVITVGSRVFVTSFQLAGVQGKIVDSPEDALEQIKEIYKDPEAGLVLLSDDLSEPINDQLTTLRAQKSTPLVFALPASGSEKSEVDYRVMLKKILGV
tara:strand:- start:1938 stop:2318 length:381 start_codon:yes stop_codon:yes gene_type:complete